MKRSLGFVFESHRGITVQPEHPRSESYTIPKIV